MVSSVTWIWDTRDSDRGPGVHVFDGQLYTEVRGRRDGAYGVSSDGVISSLVA